VHIAHRKLGGNRALARALRLRLLSEAVVEEVDETLLDVGQALSLPAPPAGAGAAAESDTPHQAGHDGLPLEKLLHELAPYVAHAGSSSAGVPAAPQFRSSGLNEREGALGGRESGRSRGSALLFRLLWLLDRQLMNAAGGAGGDGPDGEKRERDSALGSVGVWHAERVCQRLKRLPCSMLKVDKIASRFMLLQAEALPPWPLEEGGLPEAWRDAQARVDVTNPLRKFESVLVVDERHNALVVTGALLQLLPMMLAKLADSLNRTLGSVLTADSERVLSSLLGCASEEDMRETLEQMHCGNEDAECDDVHLSSWAGGSSDAAAAARLAEEGAAEVLEPDDGVGRCLVPTGATNGRRALIGSRISAADVRQMSLVTFGCSTVRQQPKDDPDGQGGHGQKAAARDSQGVASSSHCAAACLRPGDVVGIMVDSTAGGSRARHAKIGADGTEPGGAETELLAVEVLRFYPNAGLAVVSASGNDMGGGEGTGDSWTERVVVVEKEVWWLRDVQVAAAVAGRRGKVRGGDDKAADDATASEEDEEEDQEEDEEEVVAAGPGDSSKDEAEAGACEDAIDDAGAPIDTSHCFCDTRQFCWVPLLPVRGLLCSLLYRALARLPRGGRGLHTLNAHTPCFPTLTPSFTQKMSRTRGGPSWIRLQKSRSSRQRSTSTR